jgi:hypothetical protein
MARGNYNATGVDMSGNVIAPPGVYTLKVKKAYDTDKEGNPKMTKNGDPMVSVLCEVDDVGPYLGATVWNNVCFLGRNPDGSARKGAGIAIKFLKSIGEPWEGKFEWDSDNWPGRTFKARLKVATDQNKNPKNEIDEYVDGEAIDEAIPF